MNSISQARINKLKYELGVNSFDEVVHFPKYFQIETISACNARCTMCSIDSWVRTKSTMSPGLFNKIADELSDYNQWIERIILQQDGEPLLDKHLEAKIAALKEKGIRHVSFATNASLLNKHRAFSLLASGLDSIDFSIDGYTAQVFEQIRINLNFETCRDNIHQFLDLRDQMAGKRPEVRIRMCIQKSNAHEFSTFVNYWQPYLQIYDRVFGKIEQKWTGWEKDIKEMNVPWKDSSKAVNVNSEPCISPFDTFVILCDGRVGLCCLDYNASVQMGNVNDGTIREIWQDIAFANVRNAHLTGGRGAIDICRDCHNFSDSIKFSFAGLRNN